MYARSSTFAADPTRIPAALAYCRDEVGPTLKDTEGFVGLSLMTDERSGRSIATTAWSSEASLRASESKARPLRERGSAIFGVPAEVDTWEIAMMHRRQGAEPGARVRATWTRVDTAKVDLAIEMYREVLLPAIEDMAGFVSESLFVDRATGRSVTCVTFDSQDSLEASRAGATELRRAAVHENDVQILQVTEFELALAFLRVPETV